MPCRIPLATFASSLALPFVVALTHSCQSNVEHMTRPTARFAFTAAQDFEADLSALGYSVSGESEYSSLDLAIGATYYEPIVHEGEDASEFGRKVGRVEIGLSKSEFEDVDALEFVGGGRVHFGQYEVVSPFVSVHSVLSVLDDVDGFELGNQLGARVGIGAEFNLNKDVFLDLGFDYTLPLIAAESDFDTFAGSTVETELSGWALRIGFGVAF
jgi:hypothetical protein